MPVPGPSGGLAYGCDDGFVVGTRIARMGFVVILLSAYAVSGCSSAACDSMARSTFVVTVLDRAGARIFDALLTATDGDFSVALAPFIPIKPAECAYSGPPEPRARIP